MTAETAASSDQVHAEHGRMGVLGAAALVAGSMIGSGVYLLPASLGAMGSVAILGWLVATVAALAIAGVFMWLAVLVPEGGGLAGYIRNGLGRFAAVQATVLYWTSIWAGLVAVAIAVAGAVAYLAPALAGPGARLAVTLAVIWMGVGAAWAGPRTVARLEGLTLAIGLFPVLLVATAGWLAFKADVFTASWNPRDLPLGAVVVRASLTAFWAFLGVECAAAAAGVVRDPVRNVPRATLLGVGGVAAIYVVASAAIMGLAPAATLAASTAPFADAGRVILGAGLGAVLAVCLSLRALGCLAGWTLVMAETTRSAADDGDFPAVFRTRPGEQASPLNLLTAGVLMSAVAILSSQSALADQFALIANVTSLLCLYTYLMAAAALVRAAWSRPAGPRALAITTAAVAAAFCIVLVAAAEPIELAWSLAPVAAAGLLHLALRRR